VASMFRRTLLAETHAVRFARRGRRRRSQHRAWRRRSRRAQVAPVATILGLLLVVTFIASYLTTTLPNQMGQNDLQHDVQVQNQVAELSALAQAVGQRGATGAQVSQPISLGSAGVPPFAGQDGASLIALPNGTAGTANFTISGPSVYAPPTGFGTPNPSRLPSGCTVTSGTTLNCPAVNRAKAIKLNMSAGDDLAYSVTLGTGGNFVLLNFSTNGSTISVSGISGMPIYIQILGSNDTLTLSNNGGGNNPISLNITGNYDTVSAGSFPGGASTIDVRVIGDHDLINGDPASGGNTMYVSFTGVGDTLALIPGDGSTYHTYFTGFDTLNPVSPTCPYGALAHGDSVTGYNVANGVSANAHLYQTFNNSTSYPGNSTHNPSSRWQILNQTVSPFTCPFVTAVLVPFSPTGSAGFAVQLHNTYSSTAEVAYDQGAVLYAQPGGLPIFIAPPPVKYSSNVLTLFLPQFANTVAGESGVGTADVSLRLLTTSSVTIPGNSFTFLSGTHVTIHFVTPYAAAWYAYFRGYAGLSTLVTCTGANSVCTANYYPSSPLGTVTLSVPTNGLELKIVTALYAVTIA